MSLPIVLFLSLYSPSHLQLLRYVSAYPEDSNGKSNSNFNISCPSSFRCGKFRPLYFPLNDAFHHHCGLYTVFCGRDDQHPGVYIYYPSERFSLSDVTEISSHTNGSSRIKLTDTTFEAYLDSRNCRALRNLSMPNSASISVSIPHNLTLFKCNRSSSSPTDNHYFNYTCRHDPNYIYYYKYPPQPDNVTYSQAQLFHGCSLIQLPLSSDEFEPRDFHDPFKLLTASYYIELQASEDCLKCHRRGGQCQHFSKKFHCIAKTGGANVKLIILIVIAGTIAVCLLLSVIYVCHRRNCFTSYSRSRSICSDPSSKAEVEYSGVFFGVLVFKYAELEQATDNFDASSELGDGGFGTVYHGVLQDGREVAVKRLYEHNSKRVMQFLTEVEILTCLRHPNLVSLYGCTSRHSRELLLVYEYVPNGTLADHIHGDRAKDGLLTWPIRMIIALETASALAYLHATDIVHRDVKTNNLLLDNNFSVKVADFGLSRLLPTNVTHVSTAPQGTPGYVDPEYYHSYQLTDKSDVYSFGVVLIELISSMPAVDIRRHRYEINLASLALNRIQNCKFHELIDPSLGFESDSLVQRMTSSVAEVAFRCLQLEKEMRPSMIEVLEALKEIHDYKNEKNTGEMPPSPDSVMNVREWVSSSTTSISSR